MINMLEPCLLQSIKTTDHFKETQRGFSISTPCSVSKSSRLPVGGGGPILKIVAFRKLKERLVDHKRNIRFRDVVSVELKRDKVLKKINNKE